MDNLANPGPAGPGPLTTDRYEWVLRLYRTCIGIPAEGHIGQEHLTDDYMAKFLWTFFRVWKKDEDVKCCLLKAVMCALCYILQCTMLPALPNAILYPHTTTLYTGFKYEAR
jgi:hypothetical protein